MQNSKERQDEREAAFKREAKLKQEALDKQTSISALLWALAAFLTFLCGVAVAFARFRSTVAQEMEISAKQAQAGEKAKSEFLNVISHEFRTPLNTVLGMADYLSRAAPNKDMRDKNALILHAGNDLLGLIDNILDMSLIESGDMTSFIEPSDIRSVVMGVENEWRDRIEKRGILFTAFIQKDVPKSFDTDQRLVEKCLNILMSNAAKFTKKGRIHIHVSPHKDNDDLYLKIIVADTGIGIKDSVKGTLYKPFVQADSSRTRQHGGVGLGLAIARSLAYIMEGDLEFNSQDGKGSEFTLTFKQQACEEDSLPTPVRVTEKSKAKKSGRSLSQNVLVLDKDKKHKPKIEWALFNAGCQVISDKRPVTALLKKYQSDAVIINMDSYSNVLKIVRTIREEDATLPIIALTDNPAAEKNIQAMAAGINIFLSKPLSEQDLFESLKHVTANKSRSDNQDPDALKKSA